MADIRQGDECDNCGADLWDDRDESEVQAGFCFWCGAPIEPRPPSSTPTSR